MLSMFMGKSVRVSNLCLPKPLHLPLPGPYISISFGFGHCRGFGLKDFRGKECVSG